MDTPSSILVTGGAGYIGSHTCKQLAGRGHTPVTYDDLSAGHRRAVQWGPLVEGDIADTARLVDTLKRFSVTGVMHFAALTAVGESVRAPDRYYRTNVVGTLSLLEAMRTCGVARLVFSSSCATYGEPRQVPMDASHPQAPVSPYGETKRMAEQMLRDQAHAYGLRAVSLRYFNAAGADADGQIGEAHAPETHLVPLAIAAAIGRGPRLTVFGDDYDTPDGTCVRDYIHVTDLAEAHVLALGECASPAYNLGNGRGFTVRQVLAAVERVTGRPVPHDIGPRRAGDPPALVADARRARDELGWRPAHARLDTIIETAHAWMERSAQSSQ